MSDSYSLAKDIGEIQYNLILLELQPLSDKDKCSKMQNHWNKFKAIINVSTEYAEIHYSKYLPLLFAYQKLFAFEGGKVPEIEGIAINSDTSVIEHEIIEYLKKRSKECKNCK